MSQKEQRYFQPLWYFYVLEFTSPLFVSELKIVPFRIRNRSILHSCGTKQSLENYDLKDVLENFSHYSLTRPLFQLKKEVTRPKERLKISLIFQNEFFMLFTKRTTFNTVVNIRVVFIVLTKKLALLSSLVTSYSSLNLTETNCRNVSKI